MLHDHARPHTAAATQDLIATFGWEQFSRPPYSPYLALSDFHVFLHLKTFLGGRRVHDDNEIKEVINKCFASQAASFYDAAIQKLVPRYDKWKLCRKVVYGMYINKCFGNKFLFVSIAHRNLLSE
jgi:histone-lysine N-methyltransferase SETMAR